VIAVHGVERRASPWDKDIPVKAAGMGSSGTKNRSVLMEDEAA